MILGDFFLVVTATFETSRPIYHSIGACFFLMAYMSMIIGFKEVLMTRKNLFEMTMGIAVGGLTVLNIFTSNNELYFVNLVGLLLFAGIISMGDDMHSEGCIIS